MFDGIPEDYPKCSSEMSYIQRCDDYGLECECSQGVLICAYCSHNCIHKNHVKNYKKGDPNSEDFKYFVCDCALKGHPQLTKGTSSDDEKKGVVEMIRENFVRKEEGVELCDILKFSKILGINNYYKDSEDNIVCFFHQNGLTKYHFTEEETTENLKCSFELEKAFDFLVAIFVVLYREKAINLEKYCFHVFKSHKVFYKHFEKFLEIPAEKLNDFNKDLSQMNMSLMDEIFKYLKETFYINPSDYFLTKKLLPNIVHTAKNLDGFRRLEYIEYHLYYLNKFTRKYLFKENPLFLLGTLGNISFTFRDTYKIPYSYKLEELDDYLFVFEKIVQFTIENALSRDDKERENQYFAGLLKTPKYFYCFELTYEQLKKVIEAHRKLTKFIFENYSKTENYFDVIPIKITINLLIKLQDLKSQYDVNLQKEIEEYKKSILEELKTLISSKEKFYESVYLNNPIKTLIQYVYFFDMQYNQANLNYQSSSMKRHFENLNEIKDKICRYPIKSFNDSIMKNVNEFMNGEVKFSNFNPEVLKILDDINKLIHNSPDKKDLSFNLVKQGLFSNLIHLLNFYNSSVYIIRKSTNKNDFSVIEKILSLLNLISSNEPSVIPIFYNTKFLKSILLNMLKLKDDFQYESNKLKGIIIEFYYNNLYFVRSIGVRIDSNYFLHILFDKLNRTELITFEHNKIVSNFMKILKILNFVSDSASKSQAKIYTFNVLNSTEIGAYREKLSNYCLGEIEEAEYQQNENDANKQDEESPNDEVPSNEEKQKEEEAKKNERKERIQNDSIVYLKEILDNFNILSKLETNVIVKVKPDMKILEKVLEKTDNLHVKIVFYKFYLRRLFSLSDKTKDTKVINITEEEILFLNLLKSELKIFPKTIRNYTNDSAIMFDFFLHIIIETSKQVLYKSIFIDNLNENGKTIFSYFLIFFKALKSLLQNFIEEMDSSNIILKIEHIKKLIKDINCDFSFTKNIKQYINDVSGVISKLQSLEISYEELIKDFVSIMKNFRVNFDDEKEKKNETEFQTLKYYPNGFDPNIEIVIQVFRNQEFTEIKKRIDENISKYNEYVPFEILKLNLKVFELIIKEKIQDISDYQDSFLQSDITTYMKHISFVLENFPSYMRENIISVESDKHLLINDYYLKLLEITRLLCENHNQVFQTLCIRSIDPEKKSFFELVVNNWVSTNEIILYLKEYNQYINYFKKIDTTLIQDCIIGYCNFTVEVIQGIYTFNHSCLNFESSDNGRDHLNQLTKIIFTLNKDLGKLEIIDFSISYYLKLIKNYIDQSPEIKLALPLLTKLTSKILVDLLKYYFNTLYYKFILGSNEVPPKKFKVPIEGAINMIKQYGLSDEMFDDLYLNTCNDIYQIIFKLGMRNENELLPYREVSDKFLDVAKLQESMDIQNQQIAIFFSELVNRIDIMVDNTALATERNILIHKHKEKIKTLFTEEICKKILEDTSQEKEEAELKLECFLVTPNSAFIIKDDTNKIIEKAPYEKFYSRWDYLVNKSKQFKNTLKLRQFLANHSKILLELNLVPMTTVLRIAIIFIIITNLLFGMKSVSPYFQYLGMFSFILYMYYLIVMIFVWTFTRIVKKKVLGKKPKFLKLLQKSDIRPILLNFLNCLIALIFINYFEFFISFQLLTIIIVVPVMRSVIDAILLQRLQFIYSILLIVILVLFYSSISFYYFRADYYSPELNINFCHSYLKCFLHILNYGIRSGSIGDFTSFQSHSDSQYSAHFFFSWIFYFSIILIMLNVFNGIIVDTFQAQRQEKEKKENFKKNKCYICEVERSEFEKNDIDFEIHINENHDLQSYINYLLRISYINKLDLNSNESYVLQRFNEGRIDYFPYLQSVDLLIE